MSWNKGLSHFNTNLEMIKIHVKTHNPSVCIFLESNSKIEDDLEKSFPGYTIIHKSEDNHPLDRIVMLIKNENITFERLKNLESPNISSIWIKLKVGRRKFVAIGGYYRQWRLPHETGFNNTGSSESQLKRLNCFIGQAKRAKQICQRVHIQGDVNIDLSVNRDQQARPELSQLFARYSDFLTNEEFTVLNKDFTRYQSNCRPSTIDHIVSNSPGSVDNVLTIPGLISDHHILTCLFHTELLKDKPKYMWKTEWWRINPENLTKLLSENELVMGILKKTNQNIVWSNLITGINQVINTLAPTRVIQCKNNYLPYVDKEIEEKIHESNAHLEVAIRTKDHGEWRYFKFLRNRIGKVIEICKRKYYAEKM